jgi:hypothetical protein
MAPRSVAVVQMQSPAEQRSWAAGLLVLVDGGLARLGLDPEGNPELRVPSRQRALPARVVARSAVLVAQRVCMTMGVVVMMRCVARIVGVAREVSPSPGGGYYTRR